MAEVAESIGSSLLAEVVKPVVEVGVRRVKEEIHYIVDFKRELNNFHEKIQIIAGIVDNMTVVPNVAVEVWLRKAIRIIHSAEDLLDVLAYENHRSVVLKRRPNTALSGKMKLVFLPLKGACLRTKMARWIRRINGDIGTVVKEAQSINALRALVHSASLQLPAAATNAANDDDQVLQQVRRNVDTSLFVGRDSDVASVVDMLVRNPGQNSVDSISKKRLSVVAIVGFGGLGKTTLAKKICEHERVIFHFSERIWVSELKEFNIERILNKMVEFLSMSKHEDASSKTSIRKLEKYLGGKRYLLVLDDVWNTNQDLWDSMRNTLERVGGSKESMVLTTTRSDDVAMTMQAYSVHHLSGLSEDDSWSLFEQIAFSNWLKGEAFTLEAIGRKIVKKCKGVPLAIRSIAGLLRNKRNLYEWTIVEESKLWEIPHQDTGVLPSLKLSYDHLSPMLKKCFSLCAVMPKGRWFKKYELIYRWMALGFIQNSRYGNITMEDIGEEYLNKLVSISFLIVDERNELGDASTYILHDLVYDLARSVAMHERLYLEACEKENKVVIDIQHLTVVDQQEITSVFSDKMVLRNLRSLDMIWSLSTELLVHVKFLRVLCLVGSTTVEIPDSIATLKCLKFLDLQDNPIKVLPEGVMELYNLRILCLYKCKPLMTLPKGLSNLVNLRHLGLSFHLCPSEEGVIGQLSQLQIVPPLQLSEGGFQVSELGSLHHLKGTLDVKGLELVKSKLDAEKSNLSMKLRVEQLRLSWDNDVNFAYHEEVLDGLHPSPNLKVLSIRGYGGHKFPSWIMSMNVSQDHNNGYIGNLYNLIKIELLDCRRCQQLPSLGHLPSLKMIEIRNVEKLKQIGPEFYGGAELLLENSNQASNNGSSLHKKSLVFFAGLKELRLKGLGGLEEWWEPSPGKWTSFPTLEVLVFEKCKSLRKAPSKFPILRELTVKDMISSNPLRNIISNKSTMSRLKKLDIQGVEELANIPEEVGECTSLHTLVIKHCPMLTGLSDSLSKLLSLEVLRIWWCPNLTSVPNLSCLNCLREVFLFRNYDLMDAPEGLQSCKSLEELGIACCGKVETLPNLAVLSHLWSLNIRGMTKMIISRQPPDWLYNLPCLRVLYIGSYEELNEFPDMSCLLNITSLRSLGVFGWAKLERLPEQFRHFTALTTFGIYDFEKVEHLPDWLGNLTSLQNLGLVRCKTLKKLPSKEALARLTNFSYLRLHDCPLLEQAIDYDGPEYPNIASRRIQLEITNSTP